MFAVCGCLVGVDLSDCRFVACFDCWGCGFLLWCSLVFCEVCCRLLRLVICYCLCWTYGLVWCLLFALLIMVLWFILVGFEDLLCYCWCFDCWQMKVLLVDCCVCCFLGLLFDCWVVLACSVLFGLINSIDYIFCLYDLLGICLFGLDVCLIIEIGGLFSGGMYSLFCLCGFRLFVVLFYFCSLMVLLCLVICCLYWLCLLSWIMWLYNCFVWLFVCLLLVYLLLVWVW